MTASREIQLDQRQRLMEMREHLRVRAMPGDGSFEREVVCACMRQVQPIIDANSHRTGEEINAVVAAHLGIHFEEVKGPNDIQALERKYLHEQRELGFGQLAHEMADPTVDALLFERRKAAPDAADRWVAVLNVQETQARAYWSRWHEIDHRLAEPPQRRMKFFRHRTDYGNRLEQIIDAGAAELAFPASVYGPRVTQVGREELTWPLVNLVKDQFSRTSSLLSAAKAFIRHWPAPVFLLTATLKPSKQRPNLPPALRIKIDGFNASAEKESVRFIPNMRVPPTSPIAQTFASSFQRSGYENLANWTTSSGTRLPDRRVLTSSVRLGSVVYGLVSLA
jgi:hypothetical protein